MEGPRKRQRQCRPVATAVGELKEEALALCSAVGDQAAASGLPPQDNTIRTLAVELRLYAGALFSLETLSAEMEDMDHASADMTLGTARQLPCLCRLREPLGCVDAGLRTLTAPGIRDMQGDILACRDTITYVVAQSRTCSDFATLLSVVHHGHELSKEPEDVCNWLAVLNDPIHNRPPREHILEAKLLEARRTEIPQYSHAAKSWPFFARLCWPAVEHHVKELFALPRSWNFVQWVLELARATHPLHFGPHSPDSEPVFQLTSALCDGSASPLHLAAALGLPELCDALLAKGADPNASGRLGPPLYSALLGIDVLLVGASPSVWSEILVRDDYAGARTKVILRLLDAGASATYRFLGPQDHVTSLSSLAFWHSMHADSHVVFSRFMAAGAELDGSFAGLITRPDFINHASTHPETMSILLTIAYEDTIPFPEQEDVGRAIKGVMNGCKLAITPDPDGDGKLLHVADDDFSGLVVDSVMDDDVACFQRLSMDPRFDPKQPAPQVDHGTIAHLAVDTQQLAITEALIKAGVDFTARDDVGRTPFLLVENASMLNVFLTNRLPTTDADRNGRNIWHYAAANNDVCFLAVLFLGDPGKRQNMDAVTKKGSSPLDKALRFVDKLSRRPEGQWPEPNAARYLVGIGASLKLPAPYPRILSAVEWGDAELLEKLLEGGENPRAVSKIGMNAVHHVNFGASPQLVAAVQHLCEGMPIAVSGPADPSALRAKERNKYDRLAGLTPAETVFNNTELGSPGGYLIKFDFCSQHPSCRQPLSEAVYDLLLTAEVLQYRDASGACAWERFCSRVLTRFESFGKPYSAGSDPRNCLGFYSLSIETALGCLIRRGAPSIYERRTGRAAVLCLAKARRDHAHGGDDDLAAAAAAAAAGPDRPVYDEWLPVRRRLVRRLLCDFRSPLTDAFCLSREAADLARAFADPEHDAAWWLNLMAAAARAQRDPPFALGGP